MTELCGVGGTNCSGNLWNYTCACDNANGYGQAADEKSCMPRK